MLEEIRSRERWENSNVKWTEKYETAFTKFYETRNPFIWDEQFFPPKIRNQKEDQTQQHQQQQQQQQQQRHQTNNTINRIDSSPRNDEDVIITGVSHYAQAAKQGKPRESTNPGSTLIGKQVRFNNQKVNQPKPNVKNPPTTYQNKNRPPLLNNPPSQNNFGTYNQGIQKQNTYSGMNRNTGFKPNQPRPTQYINYNTPQNRNDFLYQGPTPYINP